MSTGIPKRKRIPVYNTKKIIATTLLLVVIVTIAIHFMLRMRRAYLFSKNKQEVQMMTLTELEQKSEDLSSKLEVHNSGVGEERLLRERYNLVREGEHEIIFEESDTQDDLVEITEQKPWWKKIFN